nr:MAG TPA: virion assembly protein [Bacteriophage sp.]
MGKSISKAFKSVTKAVTKTVKSFATAGTDAIKSIGRGDIAGLADAATRAASGGTISLGDKGVLNAGLTNQPKQTTQVPAATQAEADGLLNYVADLRTRKSRRSRASTVNTDGSASSNGNKLSGTTALGV